MSLWREPLQIALVKEFMARGPRNRENLGGLFALVKEIDNPSDDALRKQWMVEKAMAIRSPGITAAITAALDVMNAAYRGQARLVPGVTEGLLALLDLGDAAAHAAAWALYWMGGKPYRPGIWHPSPAEHACLLAHLADRSTDPEALVYLAAIATKNPTPEHFEPLAKLLTHEHVRTRAAASDALGGLRDPRAVGALRDRLHDEDGSVRAYALGALARIRGEELEMKLVSRLFDGKVPFLDPLSEIEQSRLAEASERLKLSTAEVQGHYERLAADYGLSLAWQRT